MAGKVILVGAGPGDPGLLTLRGAACLRAADVVLYDYLANPALLIHTRASAERICLGQHGRSRLWTQKEINQCLIEQAQAGRVVVRLKGGDPTVFARGTDELDALIGAGIPFEIVPGITAALAASSYAGIPLTHRDVASAVALITGQETNGKSESTLDYAALAAFPGTLVMYMGVTTADHWSSSLLAAGKPPATPVAIVRRCSLSDQQVVACRLDEVAARIRELALRPPAIVVIGEVVALAGRFAWWDQRPLYGQTVLVTRPRHQSSPLMQAFADAGANVLSQPAIEILPPENGVPLDQALAQLESYEWVVFSSANGVTRFLDRLLDQGRDLRALGHARLAAMGPGTTAALAEYHLQADLVPEVFRAESLAAGLAPMAAGRSCLLVRANRGREVLAETLVAHGAHVEQVVAYHSQDVAAAQPEVAYQLREGTIDWVTVTSSAIARSLQRMFGDDLRRTRLVSISPLTTAALSELGHTAAAEAATYSMPGVVEAVVQASSS